MLVRDGISKLVEDDLICPFVDEVAKYNLESMDKSDANKPNQSLTKSAEYKINCAFSEYFIRKNIIEQEREDAKSENKPEAIINQEYGEKNAKISSQLQDTLKRFFKTHFKCMRFLIPKIANLFIRS